jgi:cellulase
MLALHASQTAGGGQFYIGCAQLKVTGTGSGSCGPTISIPGAYKADDENIYIPKFYNGFDATTYKAPGGPVASCGAGSGGAAPTTPSTSKPSSSTVPTVPSVVASPSASAIIKAKPTPVTPAPADSKPAAPSAPATAPSSGAGNNGALPATFSLETFITWLQSKAGPSTKARSHARAF